MSEGLKFKTDMQFVYGVPAELAPGVARVVANNASAFTFKGTNTYLVGTNSLAVIDPGPADHEHISAIIRAAGGRRITHILVTHAHRDHVEGVRALQAATGAKTYGFPRADASDSSDAQATSEFIGADYAPDVRLKHGDRLKGDDWELSALHTPGHAPDHLCFALEGRGLVFSGDHVMAWNTSVVAPPEGRMADYLRSLELLLERDDEMLLPGHGGRVLKPRRVVKAYLLHRRWREQAILEAVRKGSDTVRKLLAVIYRDLDAEVAGAAMLSLRAHIEHLQERGLVKIDDAADVDCSAVPL
jgi:glyoxylase-like metal-dependent hydrolase (beta-lactamase superfamily II)